MTIDRHTIALISIAGSSLDVLGALYLAYDLLGGEHGPLRTLTRGVTYGALFGGGYTIALGPVFGLATGVTHGATLAWEFASAARRDAKPGFWHDTAMSGIRGLGFAIGAAYLYGPVFGAVFGLLSWVGQVVAYQFGVRPTMDYKQASRMTLSKLQLLAAVNRTVGYAASGYLSALAAQHADALSVGLRVGLSTGLVTVVVNACFPWIEWMADRMPQKTMGVLGVGLILVGFTLQSVQYWVAFLDVTVR